MKSFSIYTKERISLTSITHEVQAFVTEQVCWQTGALVLFCPHTTCGLTINEGADPDVVYDINRFFNRLIPQNSDFKHAEGNSDAHIKASMLGSSLHIIVEEGQIQLGTWQTIYLFDGDGPRKRDIWLQWI